MKRTYFLENLGCAKNQVDAETMIAVLERAGWDRVSDPAESAIIIVNSCGFIEPAKVESIEVTLDFRSRFPKQKLVMAGCLSQRYGAELAAEMAELDGIFGNRAPERIAGFMDDVLAGEARVYLPQRSGIYPRRTTLLSHPGSAFVKVSEGCRNRCSFCAIPLIRGGLYSRPAAEIVAEIRELIAEGVHEINLVAQDLSAYGLDRGGRELSQLLREIGQIESEFWVRLLYIYPESFPESVLDICRDDPRFLPYFDIPFQHASSRVLKQMGRPGSADLYLRLIDRIRTVLPDSMIRSTFLVGFLGEGEEEFAQLLRFQKTAKLDWVGAFAYSPEDGTPAYPRREEIPPPEVAEHRKSIVLDVQQGISAERLERFVGRKMDVLVEELVTGEELALARGYPHAPEVDGLVVLLTGQGDDDQPVAPGRAVTPGRVVPVSIIRRNGVDLEARLAN